MSSHPRTCAKQTIGPFRPRRHFEPLASISIQHRGDHQCTYTGANSGTATRRPTGIFGRATLDRQSGALQTASMFMPSGSSTKAP